MSSIISEELKARGTAQVLVFLNEAKSAAAAATVMRAVRTVEAEIPAGLQKHFRSTDESFEHQLEVATIASTRAGVKTASPPAAAVRYYPNLGILLGSATREGIAALRAHDRVAKVTGAPAISLIRPTAKAAADLTTEVTWGIEAMKVPSLWEQGFTGEGVLVGHLDTGVAGDHPALRGAVAHFAEFDTMGREKTPTPAPFDSDEHGTHTAATIAGRPINGRHVGVAPGAKLASALVIEGGNVVARVLGGMEWALERKARILSMSLGFRGWWDDFVQLTKILRQRKVLPVFAVGNEGPGTSRSPGNYPEALSVGAHDSNLEVADFSSSQTFKRKRDPLVPDLVAPGVGVISAKPSGGFQEMDGSSMATPHVAGLAALLLQAKPNTTVARLEQAIFRSCARPGSMPSSRANRGFPDAVAALAAL